MDRILIVEDDTNINNLLKEALEEVGYVCSQAFSGTEAKLLWEREGFQLAILDLMLPGVGGEELLLWIRERSLAPVIILTAKDELDGKIDVLTAGADDYITKPFEIKEVMARVQVQLRRIKKEYEKDTFQSQTEEATWMHRNLTISRNQFRVMVGKVEIMHLTKQEFAILELLVRNPRRVFTKEDIYEYAWDEPFMGETKTIDVHISNIRKKIKVVTSDEYIETVWGIGYRMYA